MKFWNVIVNNWVAITGLISFMIVCYLPIQLMPNRKWVWSYLSVLMVVFIAIYYAYVSRPWWEIPPHIVYAVNQGFAFVFLIPTTIGTISKLITLRAHTRNASLGRRFFIGLVGFALIFPTYQIVPLLNIVPLNKEFTAKSSLGSAISDDQQKFEDEIKELMLVAQDDVIIGFGTHKIDMIQRKELFSDKGWQEYQSYVSWVQQKILARAVKHKSAKRMIAEFIYKSQKYSDRGDKHYFSTLVWPTFCISDRCEETKDIFQIRVEFLGKIADPKNILIDSWRITEK